MEKSEEKDFVWTMTSYHRLIYTIFVVVWIAANWFFWSWWMDAQHIGDTLFFVLMTLALVYESTILPSFYLFYLGWMREPADRLPVKNLHVAMITLCVPDKESLVIIKRQLQAMVSVRYPHDSWVLDEGNDSRVRALAKELGVKYFTRKGMVRYNQPNPPFKAKTKAGNVNAWINRWGSQYDFFTQLDIDHNPREDYLDKVLGHFRNPQVAWVQAPSIYGNLDVSWTARGSAEQELVLQGPLQRGFFGFSGTPFIIGSHSTYRMKAIQEINGFQPTRAEDHLDTVVLASRGYRGVFIPEPIAIGDGPETFDTYIAQQFAWAYSMMQVLFNYTPRLIGKYTPRQAIQFLFTQTWYFLWSGAMALLFMLPAFSLLFDKPIAHMGLVEGLLHYSPLPLIAFAVWFWSRRWFQPKGLLLSWRGMLLHIARWPVVFWAFLNVIWGVQKPYMITSKGIEKGETRRFSLTSQLPYLGLITMMLGSALIYLKTIGKSSAAGYLFFVLENGLILLVIFAVGLTIDIRAMLKDKVRPKKVIRLRFKPIVTLVFITLSMLMVTTASEPVMVEAMTWSSDLKIITLPMQSPLIGAYDPKRVLRNEVYTIEHEFVDWSDSITLRDRIENARQKGRYPMITLEPCPYRNRPMTLLSDILSGRYDKVIRRDAQVIATQKPQEVIIRWGHEMDLYDLYPWSQRPEDYVAAYRYVVDLFRKEGATNAKWLWSPAGEYNAFYYYPGSAYVDYVGVTILSDPSWDEEVVGKINPSFADYAEKRYWVGRYFGKPIIVAELGTSKPDSQAKIKWLEEAVTTANKYSIRALVYFNEVNVHSGSTTPLDWRIQLEAWKSVFDN